jgi:hypothetical protein
LKSVSLRQIEILEFGKRKRYSLVERWCKINTHDAPESLKASVEAKRRTVDRMLSSNLVPRTPLIVIILLKAIDMGQSGDLSHAGYVRYYKFLIDSAILKGISTEEAEIAYALLPEIAWAVYSSPPRELTTQQVEAVIEEFSARRALRKASLYKTLVSLRDIHLFELSEGTHKFRFPYTFYFFLADYISRNLFRHEMQNEVRRLCSTVAKKESADILAFLAFHSDSSIIADTLIEGLSTLYPGKEPFDLSKEGNAPINKLFNDMPRQIIDYTKQEERRAEHLEAEEAIENHNSNEEEEKISDGGPLSTMMTALRGIEILGHIVRNHYNRIDAEPKVKIIHAATETVLRSLGEFFDLFSSSVDTVVMAVRFMTDRVDNEQDEQKKIEIAQKIVFIIAVGYLAFHAKSLARAVGDENLEITYRSIVTNSPKTILEYIDVVIRLDCFRQFPLRELKALVEKIDDNQFAMTALRCAVIERLDMRPPDKAADMQRFCEAVDLQIQPLMTKRLRK